MKTIRLLLRIALISLLVPVALGAAQRARPPAQQPRALPGRPANEAYPTRGQAAA